MSAENTAPAAAKAGARENRKPDFKVGDVSVWIEPRTDDPTKSVASIIVGKQHGPKQYFRANTEVNHAKLSADDIGHIFIGDDLPLEFQGENGPYTASLARKDIMRKPWKANPEKFDQWLNIGMAVHLEKDVVEGGQKTGAREHWGFKVDKVSFPKTIKHGDTQLELSARNVFQLLAKEDVVINGVHVAVDRVEEKGKYQRAHLATSSEAPAQTVNEAETVAVAEAPAASESASASV